jgi:glycosyltransferase involved in cell wall biosynthesis
MTDREYASDLQGSDVSETWIDEPYLLVTHIPCAPDERGGIWVEELWHTDLTRHLDYLRNFILLAPAQGRRPAAGELELDVPNGVRFQWIELPRMDTRRRALRNFPRTVLQLWRATARARVVHCSMGGWPYPLAWIAVPLARLRSRTVLVNVESAPWRVVPRSEVGLLRRVRAHVAELVVRRCIAWSDLALFTHRGYRDSLLDPRARHGRVLPATWVSDENVIHNERAADDWALRLQRDPSETRFLFAGRLGEEKGVPVLLDAVQQLAASGVSLRLSIVGQGPLLEACRALAGGSQSIQVEVFAPISYGRDFLEFVRRHDVVLIPSMRDEQPRLLFDSWSQAIPVIASDTAGLADYVQDGETGWLFPAGNSRALAERIQTALACRSDLRRLGMSGLEAARAMTLPKVHARRAELIRDLLSSAQGRMGPSGT